MNQEVYSVVEVQRQMTHFSCLEGEMDVGKVPVGAKEVTCWKYEHSMHADRAPEFRQECSKQHSSARGGDY